MTKNYDLIEIQEADLAYVNQIKHDILKELQTPVRDLTEWWLQKAQWLPELKQIGAEFENELATIDDKIKCPGFIKRQTLDVSSLLALDSLPAAIRERLEYANSVKPELFSEELAWYSNEIRRWFS